MRRHVVFLIQLDHRQSWLQEPRYPDLQVSRWCQKREGCGEVAMHRNITMVIWKPLWRRSRILLCVACVLVHAVGIVLSVLLSSKNCVPGTGGVFRGPCAWAGVVDELPGKPLDQP